MGKVGDGLPESGTGDKTREGDRSRPKTQTKKENQTQNENGVNVETETNGNGVKTVEHEPKRTPDASNLQDQLRAVTKERSRLSARVSELEPLQAEIASLRSKLNDTNNRHNQEIHLYGLGITSQRARRSIRREFKAEIAELAEADRPGFEDFVGSLKTDDFYGRLFAPSTPPKDEAPPEPVKTRKVATNVNAGAEQPSPTGRPLDADTFRGVKSRAERLELARKHGLIS